MTEAGGQGGEVAAAPLEGVDRGPFDEETLQALATCQTTGSSNGRLVRSYLERRSPWGKILRWMVALLALAAVAQEGIAVYYDHQLTTAARVVTGRQDVEVRCRRLWDEALHFKPNPGFVMWGSSRANLQLPVCLSASRWAGSPEDEGNRVAIMVFTHELAHLAGHFDESETECVAMWAVDRAAVALGGTAADGRATARWYATNHNPLLRADYRAPGCLGGPEPRSALLP